MFGKTNQLEHLSAKGLSVRREGRIMRISAEMDNVTHEILQSASVKAAQVRRAGI